MSGMQRTLAIITALAVLSSTVAPSYAGVVPYFRSSGTGAAGAVVEPTVPDDTDSSGGLTIGGLTPSVRARLGVPFRLQPTLAGAASATWSVVQSSLPAGLALDTNGAITGSPVEIVAAQDIRLRAESSDGKHGVSRTFIVDVKPAPAVTLTQTAYQFETGLQAAITPQASNIYGTASWSLVGGRLPYGLSINSQTGTVTGTPEQEGVFGNLRLAVVDADGARGETAAFSIAVTSTLKISGLQASYQMRAGKLFSMPQPQALGSAGSVRWELADGALPNGVIVDPFTGALNGTPQGITSGEIRIRATDQRAQRSVVSAPISISVLGDPTATVENRKIARIGDTITVTPQAFGVIGSPIWSLYAGILPNGMRVSTSTGAASGKILNSGVASGLVFQVTDSADGSYGRTAPASIETLKTLKLAVSYPPTAKVGREFSWAIPTAAGIYGEPTWAVDNLPAGLNFDAAERKVVGVPSAAGSRSITVRVTDAHDGRSDARTISLLVNPANAPETFEISGVPETVYGEAGRQFVGPAPLVTGATGQVTWSLASGELPAGFTIDAASGVIGGFSAEPVTIPGLQLRARDAATANSVVSSTFSIAIQTPVPLSVSLASSNLLIVDQQFEILPQIRGANGSKSFTVAGGSLPGWAVLDRTSGRIFGYAAEIGQTEGIVLQVEDSEGAVATSNAFSITVSTQPAPSISGIGSRYYAATASLYVSPRPDLSNAQAPVRWELAGGALPAWASLDEATGQIVGTPLDIGTTEGLFLRVTDARNISATSSIFGLTVTRAPLTASFAQTNFRARQGGSITTPAPALTGATGVVSYSIAAGSLPAWATVNSSTGQITATSQATASITGISLRVDDAGAGQSAVTQPINLIFVGSEPVVAAPTQFDGVATHEFTATPTASNVVGAQSWTLADGQLPSWATLDAATGQIGGTPPQAGTVSGLRLRLTDSDGAIGLSPLFSIVIDPKPGIDVRVASSFSRTGRSFSLQPTVEPAGAYSWSASAALPGGLQLSGTTGAITGTPLVATAVELTLTARDGTNDVGVSRAFSIAIAAPLTASVGEQASFIHPMSPYVSAPAVAGNAQGVVSWAARGNIPAGLELDETTGVISGSASSEGVYQFELIATDPRDGSSAASATASISVIAQPQIAVQTVYQARAGFASSIQPTASNTIGSATWTLADGELPAWASLNATTGAIQVLPSEEGTFGPFQLKVVDSRSGAAMSSPFQIVVGQSFQATYGPATYTGRINRTLSTVAPAISGQAAPVTWELAAGALPTEFTLNAGTAVISGRPLQEVSAPGLRLRGRDATGASVLSPVFSIDVLANPKIIAESAETRLNAAFSLLPRISGSIGTPTVSIASGDLPAWAEFNNRTGEIKGRPNAVGTDTLSLRVTDSEGAVGDSATFTISVDEGMTVSGVQPSYLGRVGRGFTGPVPHVAGASGALAWGFETGKPGWMGIASATGGVSGTPNAPGTTSGLKIKVTDPVDGATAASQPFASNILGTLNIQNVPTEYVAHVNRAFAPPAPVGSNVGGTASWTIGQGQLPTWAGAVDPATGAIRGTPQAVGSTTGLTLRLADSADGEVALSKPFTLSVIPDIEVVDVSTAYVARFGFPFRSSPPRAINSVGSPSWSLARGALPSWASVDPRTGEIYGDSPQLTTTANLGLRATDMSGGDGSSNSFSLSVFNKPSASVSASSYRGRVGTSFSLTPQVEGIAGTPQWSVAAGALPQGLVINEATGQISGSPEAPDYQPLALQVRDQSDGATAETQGFTVEISDTLQVTGLEATYRGRQNTYMALPAPVLQNARGAVTRSLNRSAPTGMTFNSTTGVLSGSPSAIFSDVTFGVVMRDSFDNQTATGSFVFSTVGALNVNSSTARTARVNADFTLARPIVGNVIKTIDDIRWTTGSGTLPVGLTLSETTGVISGIPTEAGSFSFQHRARDVDNATATPNSNFALTVLAPLAVTGPATVLADQNVPVSNASFTITQQGGDTTWSVTGLPSGVEMTGTGLTRQFTGTTTQVGVFPVSITVTDSFDGTSTTYTVSLDVRQAPSLAFLNASNTIAAKEGVAAAVCTPVRLRNNGPREATGLVGSIEDSSNFEICTPTAQACSTIAVGAECNIGVRMLGSLNGAYTGTVRATSANGGTTTAQVSGSIAGVVEAGYRVFTTADMENGTATFTPMKSNMAVRVLVIGGGGGGGTNSGGNGQATNGGGGGAGYIASGSFSINGPVAVTVGSGGPAVTAGTASSFGSLISANGGANGGRPNGGNGSSGGGSYHTNSANPVNGGGRGGNGQGISGSAVGLGMGTANFTSTIAGFGAAQGTDFGGVVGVAVGGTSNGSSDTTAPGGRDCYRAPGGGGAAGLTINGVTPEARAARGGTGFGAGGGGANNIVAVVRNCSTAPIVPGGTGLDGAVVVMWNAQ